MDLGLDLRDRLASGPASAADGWWALRRWPGELGAGAGGASEEAHRRHHAVVRQAHGDGIRYVHPPL